MNIVSVIAEYNPFHLGHKYHLEESLKKTNASHSIALMSGSFVQRGEPSIVDKWSKAEMAIDNGFDLVIELPTIFSTQTAEIFSLSAIKILDSLKVVDYISFGSEYNDIDDLKFIANLLNNESLEYKELLKENLKKGYSYPYSRELALGKYIDTFYKDIKFRPKDIINKSNNILAIEYLKALEKIDSNIDPVLINRLGADYNEESLNSNFSSATSIRKNILTDSLKSVEDHISSYSYSILKNYQQKYNDFNHIDNYIDIINYLLITKDSYDLIEYFDINKDLANRYINNKNIYKDIDSLLFKMSTNIFTRSRIKRNLIHILLDIKRKDLESVLNMDNSYIRILASNKKGFEIINKINDRTDLHIINKFSDYHNISDIYMKTILDIEKKATDIYFSPLKKMDQFIDLDYKTSPYIVTK